MNRLKIFWSRRDMLGLCFEMWKYHMFSTELEEQVNRRFFWEYLNWNQFETQ